MRTLFSLWGIVWLLGIVGWIANIVKLIHMGMPVDVAHTSVLFILRVIGIFAAPFGSVLGLFF